jgi:hypothetical protein
MGLIEDNQVIRNHFGFLQAREHSITAQGIDADNKQITILSHKRVAYFRVVPADYAKSEIEKRACQHLANVEACHNGFSRASVIGQQEAQPALLEHVIIDGNALVWQGVNHGDFSGEKVGLKRCP